MKRYTGSVTAAGELKLDAPLMWEAALSALKGKRVAVALEPENTIRSNEQNRRFWGVIVPVCREILNQHLAKGGYPEQWSAGKTHRVLESWFIEQVETPLGFVSRTCSELSVSEFAKFTDAIEQTFVLRFGAVFPSEQDIQDSGL